MPVLRTDNRFGEDLALDREQAVALLGHSVSRETWSRLDGLVTLLLKWQKTTNLIAPSTISQLWTRHVADSLQLLRIAHDARRWIDLGSGAGFPGLVVAAALADAPGAQVHLVESNKKKSAFLREATRIFTLPAIVHAERIEDFVLSNNQAFDVVSARAVAPLQKLISLAFPLLKTGAVGLFPKGQDVGVELTQASKSWTIDASLSPSLTNPHGRIVVVRQVVLR